MALLVMGRLPFALAFAFYCVVASASVTHTVEILTSTRRFADSTNSFRARLFSSHTGWSGWFDLGNTFKVNPSLKLSIEIPGSYVGPWTKLTLDSTRGG